MSIRKARFAGGLLAFLALFELFVSGGLGAWGANFDSRDGYRTKSSTAETAIVPTIHWGEIMVIDSFNLAAPPGFRGLHPDLPVECSQRHLPHWRQAGATYFVTFRLEDSIPQEHVRALKRWRDDWERSNPEPRSEQAWEKLAREITSKTEAYLDQGYGECVFRESELAEVMSEAMLFFQDKRHWTSCFTVMPNHVHLVMKPLGDYEMDKVLGSVKRFVTHKVNEHLGREGKLWEQESYDRIVRDEEHLFRVIQYIGRNPKKAGLPDDRWCRWIHPEWKDAGWGFQE